MLVRSHTQLKQYFHHVLVSTSVFYTENTRRNRFIPPRFRLESASKSVHLPALAYPHANSRPDGAESHPEGQFTVLAP